MKKLHFYPFFFIFLLAGCFLLKPFTCNAEEKGLQLPIQEQVAFKNEPPEKKSEKQELNETIKARIHESHGKLPLYFIQNDGQVDKKVKFYEKSAGHATYFTTEGVYLLITRSKQSESRIQNPESKLDTSKLRTLNSKLIKLVPLGANKNPEIVAKDLQEGRVNYFIGNDPKKWKTNIPTYRAVAYKEIYKGIDIRFYGNNRQMEYDIIVKPGANPSMVKLAYKGIKGLRVTEDGDLEISLKHGKFIQKKPYVYQDIGGKRIEVEGNFKIINPQSAIRNPQFAYGFEIASYDKRYPVVIDPTLTYSTFLGGSLSDYAYGIAVDGSGNTYITGSTDSTDFPTASPIYGAKAGFTDAFVTKINAAGSALVYSTYLGGSSGGSYGYGIAVDASGNAYITGYTWSTSFPTVSPFQAAHGGGFTDAFVTKLNAAGSALTYSTYLGGSGSDYGFGIAVDAAGYAYVTGSTASTNFPAFPQTGSPLDATCGTDGTCNGGFTDAFVTKFWPAGGGYYSTYLGGSKSDTGYSIKADAAGNAYITGTTTSADFPTTVGAYDTTCGTDGTCNSGLEDVFVTKLDSIAAGYTYSTYIGGSGSDTAHGIALDAAGNAYITGYTTSTDFPATAGAYDTTCGTDGTCNSGLSDVFVTKLNAAGSALIYSTYLGGSGYDYGYGIAVDASGNAYITGSTNSTNFPTLSPIQGANAGGIDAFASKINPAGTSIVFSTYLGGVDSVCVDCNYGDYGKGIAVLSDSVYVTGYTYNTSFPTASPIQAACRGCTGNTNPDAFVAKITLLPNITVSPVSYNFGTVTVGGSSAPQTFTVTNTGEANLAIGVVTVTGANAADFVIGANTCTNATITPQSTCTVNVVFSPASAGSKSANLSIPSNDPDTPTLNVPLSGTTLQYTLTVLKTGTGTGTVTSNVGGINCGATCSASYNSGTVVTLAAAASADSTFSGWSGGGCSGTGTCTVTMNAATTVTATFTYNPPLIYYTLTVSKSGTGSGTVTGSGINCGFLCSNTYVEGTAVTLTATASTGSTFTGWSGSGCSGTGTCTLTMNADKTVTATFNLKTYSITATAGTGGSISPSGTVTVNHGANQTFTITPNAGFFINDVKVDNTSVGEVTTYTFNNVTADHKIEATFVAHKLICMDGGSLKCLERVDGGSDGDNFFNGKPKGDLDYEFIITVKDATGNTPQHVILYIAEGSNTPQQGSPYRAQVSNPVMPGFYANSMTCTGNMISGGTCIYVTKLGPIASHQYFFEATMHDGTVLRYPDSGHLNGPEVQLLAGYNMLGIPKNLGSNVLDGSMAFGSTGTYRWNSSSESYAVVTTSNPVKTGEGYFVYKQVNALPVLGVYSEILNTEYTYELKHGWNIISNPYSGNIKLIDVKIKKGGSTPVSWVDATTKGWVVPALYSYNGDDWGRTYTYGTETDGVFTPWIGYWIYLNTSDDIYSIIFYKP